MYPFTANAAPVPYDMGQQQQYQHPPQQQQQYQPPPPQSNYSVSGYPQYAPQPAPPPQYGTVQYPAANPVYPPQSYTNNPYQPPPPQQQQHHGGSTYTGLDAAVYSAATAMLAERGITPQTKTYSNSYQQSGSANNAGGSWKNRIEQMNPTVPTSTPPARGNSNNSSSRGRGGGGGIMAGRGGRGGGGGPGAFPRYGNKDKPKDPANQTMHYCEVCKVSCAGAVAHIVGAKHKKREAQVKLEQSAPPIPTAPSGPGPSGAAPSAPAVARGNPLFSRHQIVCELCSVTTAGKAAYDAHLNGKAHQRTLKLHLRLGKPIPKNEPTIVQKTVDTVGVRTDTTTRSTGSNICTKVVTDGKTVLITPKMNFVGGTVLTTTVGGLQEVANGNPPGLVAARGPAPAGTPVTPSVIKKPESPRKAAPKHTVNPNAAGSEAIGQSYVQKLEKEGKVAYYKCTLCDCEFSDESGMNSHIRGRRHRTSYQKKVDPTIVVELSSAQKKMKEKARAISNRGRPGPAGKRPAPGGPRGPPAKRIPRGLAPPDWGMAPHPHQYGPPAGRGPYGPPGPHFGYAPGPVYHYQPPRPLPPVHAGPGPRPANMEMEVDGHPENERENDTPDKRPAFVPPNARLDQQYLLHKHRFIIPDTTEVDSLSKTLGEVEKALKLIAEKLMLPLDEKEADAAPVAPAPSGDAAAVPAATAPPRQRMLKGSYRFGAMTKNLLTKNDLFGEILLICNRHPSAEDLKTVAEKLREELKVVSKQEFIVIPHPDKCSIFVKANEAVAPAPAVEVAAGSDGTTTTTTTTATAVVGAAAVIPTFPVWVYMAYANLRDELLKRETENSTANAAGSGGSIGDGGGLANTASTETPSMTTTKESSTAQQPSPANDQSSSQPQLAAAMAASGSCKQTADGQAAAATLKLSLSAVDAIGALDLKRSLAVLAQSRRTRWFQEFIAFFPQCRMLMRILNNLCEYQQDLRPLAGWPIEFLIITVLRMQSAYHGITPFDIPLAEAFWMILSTVSSGVFLPGCPNGFKDPCERGNVDVLGSLEMEERVKLTRATGEVLNRWLTGNYATVLDVEPLAGDPLYPAAVEESKEEPVAANGIVDESAVAAAGKSTLVVPHPSSASAANASGIKVEK